MLNPAEAAVLASESQKQDVVVDHTVPLPHPRLSRTPAHLPGAINQDTLQPGLHTQEVLAELGYNSQDIDRLAYCGALGSALAGNKSTGVKL